VTIRDKDDKKCYICGKSATKLLASSEFPAKRWFCMDHKEEWNKNG
jgi:hypothetical protein